MTLDFSKLKDVVFYKDTVKFMVVDENFAYNCEPVEFDKATQYVRRVNDREPILYVEDPASVFGRADWRTYVSPDVVDVRPKKDMVDQPSHYRRYGMESIDAMRGTMSPDEFNGFLKGNAFKYLTRAGAKDALEQDLHKVCWYTMFLYLANGGTVEALGKTYEYMKERFAK